MLSSFTLDVPTHIIWKNYWDVNYALSVHITHMSQNIVWLMDWKKFVLALSFQGFPGFASMVLNDIFGVELNKQ